MGLRIRQATLRDACWVAVHIREEDAEEIWASSRTTPGEAVLDSFKRSDECYAVIPDDGDDPVAIFGVAGDPDVHGLGIVWLLATPGIHKIALSVFRLSSVWIDWIGERYPLGLHNAAYKQNHLHIRWCMAAGFASLGDVEINGHTFTHIFRKPNYV